MHYTCFGCHYAAGYLASVVLYILRLYKYLTHTHTHNTCIFCRLTEPIEFIRRPGGLGLGAVPLPPDLVNDKKKKNKIKLPGDVERKVGVVNNKCLGNQ